MLRSLFVAAALLLVFPASPSSRKRAETAIPPIIPRPARCEMGKGSFHLQPWTKIYYQADSKEAGRIARYLSNRLAPATGVGRDVHRLSSRWQPAGSILVTTLGADPKLGDEGYELITKPGSILIRAPKTAGLFYGVQTLRQMLPSDIEQRRAVRGAKWIVPAARIWDRPRFGWRGLLLDVSRHFRDKEFVKRYIDLLAYQKMNVLHWHLVDDQGWRLEIKKYPKLTEVGAWRMEDGHRYGGFYTQDDVREIVSYAASRYVTVVPEIEMPGHSNAALAAYPENSCTGGPFQVPSLWGVFDDVYCPGKDGTLSFLKDVLTEVMDLFPSKFIHVGGDEVPKTKWHRCPNCNRRMREEHLKDERELQSWFIEQMDKFLASKGRRLVGWDEILEGGLAPGATVQSWRGMEGAVASAKMGHDVVVSPTNYCYLDYSYDSTSVEKSYSFEPVPAELTPAQAQHVLGGEGNIWAEQTPLPQHTDRQVFPRLCALAEVYWSPREVRAYPDFARRLGTHLDRIGSMGVRYYIQKPQISAGQTVFTDSVTVTLTPAAPTDRVVYTLDGSEPGFDSPSYTRPVTLTSTTTIKAATIRKGRAMSDPAVQTFRRETYRTPTTRTDLVPGLSVAGYEGGWSRMPNFSQISPTFTATSATVDLSAAKKKDNFGLVFEGYVEVPADGIYTFYLSSDDGSRMFVGGDLVVDNDGTHAPSEQAGQVALRAGKHPIRIEFFQVGGPSSLSLSYSGPKLAKRPVPASALYTDGG